MGYPVHTQDVEPSRETVRFSVFELDARSGELRKQGVKIKLQDQPLQILQILLEHPGEVITREQLQKRIWPSDTFVDFDHGLYNAVKKLREALGDVAATPRFVETLPKRGYRFIGTVNGAAAAGPISAAQIPQTSAGAHKYQVAALTVVGTIALMFGLLFAFNAGGLRNRLMGRNHPPVIHSLAVLPLKNLSDDPAQKYFSYGMTEELITDLAQVSGLKVISHTSVIPYENSSKPLPQIARELNVDGIVEGTVQRSGNRVRTTAQLIYGPADQHLWANSFERDVKDLLDLQDAVASEIATQIQVKLTPEEQAKLKNPRPVSLKALDAYVEARFHLDQAASLCYYKGKDPVIMEEARKAVSYLDLAIEADPNYLPAYVSYFDAVGSPNKSRMEYLPNAKAALKKVLELDEANESAHITLGKLLMQYEYDWAAAEKEFRRAIRLNPNSGDAHFQYSEYLRNAGRETEGDKEFDLAEALNPAHDYVADAYSVLSRPGRTLDQERQTLEEQAPNNPFLLGLMGRDYAIAGKFKESVEMWERCLKLYGWLDFANLLKSADAKVALEEWMRAGEDYEAKHGDMLVVPMAFTYSSLGNKDRAFAWLDKAVEQRNWMIIYLKDDNVWDPLRSDPRFGALLRRVGLPQ